MEVPWVRFREHQHLGREEGGKSSLGVPDSTNRLGLAIY